MKRGEDPPTPPPRPQKTHSRASSLDLNKVFQPSVPGEVPLCTPALPFPVRVSGWESATEAFVSPENEQTWLFPIPGKSTLTMRFLGGKASSRQIDITCVWSLAHTCSGLRIMKFCTKRIKMLHSESPLSVWLGSCYLHPSHLYTRFVICHFLSSSVKDLGEQCLARMLCILSLWRRSCVLLGLMLRGFCFLSLTDS